MKNKVLADVFNKSFERSLAAPSILAGDFGCLSESAKLVEKYGADLLHIDIMDGQFVPNITLGPDAVKSIRKSVRIPLDVHLMIKNPDKFIKEFADAGADIITVHIESEHDMEKTLSKIKKYGICAGVVLNPDTDVEKIERFLKDVSLVLVMSVYPGFGGQEFISDVLWKVDRLEEIRRKNRLNYLIEIDGGINEKNAKAAFEKGVDILVAGTYVYKSDDIRKAIKSLQIRRL